MVTTQGSLTPFTVFSMFLCLCAHTYYMRGTRDLRGGASDRCCAGALVPIPSQRVPLYWLRARIDLLVVSSYCIIFFPFFVFLSFLSVVSVLFSFFLRRRWSVVESPLIVSCRAEHVCMYRNLRTYAYLCLCLVPIAYYRYD